MGINNVNEQSSAWGAVFRKKPVFFMTVKETEAFFNGKMRRNMELWEDTCTLSSNNTYRRPNTTYEVYDRDKGSAFLDMGFLIKDETSSLKGNLSDENDVDFYNFSIPFMNFQRNYFGIEAYIDMPEGCDYDLTLYDEYGNQVGKAEWDGKGRKTLTIPNWDMQTDKYCIKVENGNGEEISPDDYYKISLPKIRSMKRWMSFGKHSGNFTTHTAGRMKTGGNILISIMQFCGRQSRII